MLKHTTSYQASEVSEILLGVANSKSDKRSMYVYIYIYIYIIYIYNIYIICTCIYI